MISFKNPMLSKTKKTLLFLKNNKNIEIWKQLFFSNKQGKAFLKELNTQKRSVPESEWIMHPFAYFPPEETKAVFIKAVPLYAPKAANGLCFNVNKQWSGKFQSTIFINKYLDEYYDIDREDNKGVKHPDVIKWAKQGVLLLHDQWAMTDVNRTNELPQYLASVQFTENIIRYLMSTVPKLPFIFWDPSVLAKYRLLVSHYMLADYTGKSIHRLGTDNPFSLVNLLLKMNHQIPIQWL